ncbi:MAG: alginate lyase family protein [Chloroflexota bacterium]|nr:alginate lyase family protein [Chloroflexota bacterium]
MRQKSLPLAIRYAPSPPREPLRAAAPGLRPRRARDWLATMIMAVAIPALIVPLVALGAAHTGPATPSKSVDSRAATSDGQHAAAALGASKLPSGAAKNGKAAGLAAGRRAPKGSTATSSSPRATVSASAGANPDMTAATGSRGIALTAKPQPVASTAAAVVVARPPAGTGSILISAAERAARPMSGAAWDSLKRQADSAAGTPNLADMNQSNNVVVLAKALVYARTGNATYRAQVLSALHGVIGTEAGAATLSLGRELAAYVLAADLIGLRSADPAFDSTFRAWLASLLSRPMADGSSLRQTHERRPNNWGTHAGASRAAIAAYLGDTAELARVAQVFKGWLGDRASYAGFKFHDLAWQADASRPVGINPAGSTKAGHSVDGVLPDDQRRTGGFVWPPPCGNYPYGALDGALLQAEILWRAGYDAYNWQNKALLRAQVWLHATGCPPTGDNVWQMPLIDARYGTRFWGGGVVRPGKNFGWTDWLYSR